MTPQRFRKFTRDELVSVAAGKAPRHRAIRYATADDAGYVAWLMLNAPLYHGVAFKTCADLIFPPLELRQAIVSAMPRGFASWALVSDAVHARLLTGEPPQPVEWNSGPHLWAMDIICPWGGREILVRHLNRLAAKHGFTEAHYNTIDKNGAKRLGAVFHVSH